MKRIKKYASLALGLVASAVLVMNASITSYATDYVFKYLELPGTVSEWNFINKDYDKDGEYKSLYYFNRSGVRNGDNITVIGDSLKDHTVEEITLDAHLASLTYAYSKGIVFYTNGIDRFYGTDFCLANVHGEVGEAHVYPGASVNFYDNVGTLILYKTYEGVGPNVAALGTVDQVIIKYIDGRVHQQFYNVRKGMLDISNGSNHTKEGAYSLIPTGVTNVTAQPVAAATTKKGNVDYSLVFNAKYYADTYPDLRAAFGYDENKLFNHFVTLGMKEGRTGISTFNVWKYKENYEDLRKAFGDDLTKYYLHYINNGYAEKRNAS